VLLRYMSESAARPCACRLGTPQQASC
jgi:hypothetical protein